MSVLHRSPFTRRSLLLAGSVALLPLGCASAQLPPSRKSQLLGAPLPAFNGITVNGSEFDSNSSAGMVLLVEFFDCREESRSLDDATSLYASNRELVIVGVSLAESIEATRGYVAQHAVKFPVLFDPKRSVAERVGVTSAQASLAVDRRGILRWVGDSSAPGVIREAAEALLAES